MAASTAWKIQAKERQQEVCELVSEYDWESYKKNEREYLEKKVEYIIFGPNQNTLDVDTKKTIKQICEKIIKESNYGNCAEDETYMAFICVFWIENCENLKGWPVFKVPKDKAGTHVYFIDINSRVYTCWNDFLQNNQFPACDYCYPIDGKYNVDENGTVLLEYGKSPACHVSKRVVQYFDYANSGLALGTTAISLTSLFFPVASPLLQASVWLTRGILAYTSVRSGSTLYDRGTHKQSVGLQDSESRNCWLSLGGSVIGAASSSAQTLTSKMAQSGQVLGKFGCATVNALTVGNLAVNGLGLLNSFHGLKDKYNNNQLSSLDVVQFSASVLLFGHAAVNIQTAKTIIEQTQNGVIQEFENNLRSNRHRKMFRKVVRNTNRQKNTMEGNAQVIRSLKHINNVDDFFSALVRMDKQFRPTQSKATLAEGGFITVNENLSLHPTTLVQATPDERILILEATKKYAGNQISEVEFRRMTESIIGSTPSVLPQQGSQPLKTATLKEILGLVKKPGKQSIQKIGLEFSYPLLSAYERIELLTLLKKFDDSDHEQILKIATTMLKVLGLNTGLQYVEIVHFVCGLIRSIARNSKIEKSTNAKYNNITVTQYCKEALQQVIRDPSKLVSIFHHIKLLFDLFSGRNWVPARCKNVGLYEIAQLAGILIIMDQPLWLRVIQFAERIFHILDLRNPEKIIHVIQGLCCIIQNMLTDIEKEIERKQYLSGNAVTPNEHHWTEERKEISRNQCTVILNTLTEDSEIQNSVLEEIRKDYIAEAADPSSKDSNTELKYTEQQPLVIKRSFWHEGNLQLLSEEEILDICMQCLCLENWPTDYSIDRSDISKILVNEDNKLVVIECDFNKEIISSYVFKAPML